MPDKPDYEKAASIVKDAGGTLVGRTKLQKTAYFLEITGLGGGFVFEYRHYGPFSEQLSLAMSTAVSLRFVCEEERPTGWGGTYSVYTANAADSLSESEARRKLIAKAAKANPIALELAATAAYLAKDGESDPWTETERRKPDKAALRLNEAKLLYLDLQAVPTPIPLPIIEQPVEPSLAAR